jgi:hypothetical protein
VIAWSRHFRERRCLLKDCEQYYRPSRPQSRYCGTACQQAARRWRRTQASRRWRHSDAGKEQPPRAQNKRYWAELSRELDEEIVRGQELVFQQLATEIDTRRKPGQWLIHLCDGQTSWDTDRQTYLPEDARTLNILDLMHVLPRVWEAAHVFHKEASVEASNFVRHHLTRILRGEIGTVIANWRRQVTCQRLPSAKKKTLRTICDFLAKNKHRMRYEEYLRLGCPVATGVIEGACRHVIKDRMERADMRWKVPGAQAPQAGHSRCSLDEAGVPGSLARGGRSVRHQTPTAPGPRKVLAGCKGAGLYRAAEAPIQLLLFREDHPESLPDSDLGATTDLESGAVSADNTPHVPGGSQSDPAVGSAVS